MHVVVCVAAVAVAVSARGDDAKRRAELERIEKLLRTAAPTEPHEIAAKKKNDLLLEFIGKAESMELLSLDPKPLAAAEAAKPTAFHGYTVIHRVTIAPADQRTKLAESLGRELHWSVLWQASCFNPRHGLRVVVSKDVVDLVICFECHRMEFHTIGQPTGSTVLLGSKWEAADELLRAAEAAVPGPAKK